MTFKIINEGITEIIINIDNPKKSTANTIMSIGFDGIICSLIKTKRN